MYNNIPIYSNDITAITDFFFFFHFFFRLNLLHLRLAKSSIRIYEFQSVALSSERILVDIYFTI